MQPPIDVDSVDLTRTLLFSNRYVDPLELQGRGLGPAL